MHYNLVQITSLQSKQARTITLRGTQQMKGKEEAVDALRKGKQTHKLPVSVLVQ